MRKSMKRMIKTAVMVFILSVCAFVLAITASAARAPGFSAIPILPENQNPDTIGSFDLRVNAGDHQEIVVTLGNSRAVDMSVEVSMFTVGTNGNGVMDFGAPGRPDVTMAHGFADIARIMIDSRIIIPPGGSVDVPVMIEIPEEGFDGLILGSFHILIGLTEEELEGGGMMVNEFAHAIAVRLQERDTVVEADFALGDVNAGIRNGRATITAEVRHLSPRISRGVTVFARVYHEDYEQAMFEVEDMDVNFAPNSVFGLRIRDRAGFGLQAGNYRAVIALEYEGRTWDFEYEFTLESAQAAAINEQAVNLIQGGGEMPSDGIPLGIIIAIAGGAVVVVAVIIAVILMKNKVSKQSGHSAPMAQQQQQQRGAVQPQQPKKPQQQYSQPQPLYPQQPAQPMPQQQKPPQKRQDIV